MARFVLLPGQRHDTIGVPPLIEGVAFGALLGDRAFDADWLRAELDTRGAVALIPPKANRKGHFDFDRHAYRWRHLIENFFDKLKEFRAIATHYDKTIPASGPASISLPQSSHHDERQQTLERVMGLGMVGAVGLEPTTR